jgi:prevent-host-death family protein
MSKTQVRPARDLRNNYAEVARMLDRHDRVIITKNGVGHSVLINIEDYAEYEDFLHHRFIYEELRKSKAEVDDPNIELRGATDVFDRIKQRIAERGL